MCLWVCSPISIPRDYLSLFFLHGFLASVVRYLTKNLLSSNLIFLYQVFLCPLGYLNSVLKEPHCFSPCRPWLYTCFFWDLHDLHHRSASLAMVQVQLPLWGFLAAGLLLCTAWQVSVRRPQVSIGISGIASLSLGAEIPSPHYVGQWLSSGAAFQLNC